jgi:predicted lipid-binding transport protein (Tim44 family)
MKQTWMALLTAAALVLVSTAATLIPTDAEAKRLGGGRSQGMQRSTPAQSTPTSTPATPAPSGAPTNAAAAAPMAGGAAAAAAAPKRNWMGPIAGLAAGLGIAALMSHLGMGEAFGNFLMMALLAVAAIFLVTFLMRRFGGRKGGGMAPQGMQLAPAGAGGWNNSAPVQQAAAPAGMQRSTFDNHTPSAPFGSAGAAGAGTAVAAAAAFAPQIPADFDRPGFERIAKMIFIRLQTANDSGDLNDLRNFTTPEMFAAIRLDLQERGAASQTTDVVKVDAEVLEVSEETDRQVVSVRFHGLVREERDAAASDFNEIWHLVKPADDSRSWAIAGIQQLAA